MITIPLLLAILAAARGCSSDSPPFCGNARHALPPCGVAELYRVERSLLNLPHSTHGDYYANVCALRAFRWLNVTLTVEDDRTLMKKARLLETVAQMPAVRYSAAVELVCTAAHDGRPLLWELVCAQRRYDAFMRHSAERSGVPDRIVRENSAAFIRRQSRLLRSVHPDPEELEHECYRLHHFLPAAVRCRPDDYRVGVHPLDLTDLSTITIARGSIQWFI